MLADNGFAVYMTDLTGYGASGGGLAMGTFVQLQDDIGTLFKQIKEDLPIFLFGHSMGGGLVTNFVYANPDLKLAGVILNAPFYRFPGKVRMGKIKLKVLKTLADAVPEILIGSKISINSITKKKSQLETYPEDKLCVPYLTLGMVNTLIDITLPLKGKNIM